MSYLLEKLIASLEKKVINKLILQKSENFIYPLSLKDSDNVFSRNNSSHSF